MNLSLLDLIVVGCYAVSIIALALYVSRDKGGHTRTSKDYFLAGNSLTWWAIGSSLIASNISAEQFVGMSGAGYDLGIGIASYELMAAATLILIAKFFLPIFIKHKIYTMPQFLEQRYDGRVRTVLAIFWMIVYVSVNLTSVLYLGALTIEQIVGWDLMYGIFGLALFALVYSLYGGLMAVAWTDVVQVIVLLFGGIFTTWMALDAVSDGAGPLSGAQILIEKVPEKFHLILSKDNPRYMDLPGISVLVGGMWVVNLYYWGCNQYITQRALAAKSLNEAQKGIIFASYLKILMPIIVVIPGVAAYVLTQGDLAKADGAYPWLLGQLPTGIKGLAFAGLMAAIVSSLSSMLNSFSTIFTIDIYKPYFAKNTSEKELVNVGRISMVTGLVIAVAIARPLLGNLPQAFEFIQNMTGYVSPGILTVFLFGFFWSKSSANAALIVSITGVILSYAITALLPNVPFIDRMGIVFLCCAVIMIVASKLDSKSPRGEKMLWSDFHTDHTFNILSIVLCVLLVIIYSLFW